MSSLKKHAFSPAPVPIALQDFAPNVELTYRDHTYTLRDNTVRATLTSAVIDTPLHHNHYFTPPTSHYIVIDKLNFSTTPSTPCLQAAAQPSSDSHLKSQLTNTKTHRNLQENNSDFTALHTPDFWLLTQQDRILVKGGLRISLTTIESALIKKMLHHEERVVSKEELIRNIGREPELYRGLEMCLSRLQEKFKRVNDGERLFRSVRNRGYCLTQKIKKSLELTTQRH
ncbi:MULTISPECIES: helix-turn-helix domain-containing protein [Pseudomonas]|uniref:OmpR/PhoB-type domain-containing protein n=2 Tax=Pseudomonas TaxID=286 RepID=A0A5M9J1T8_9PSED|nr:MULTISPECIES: winged helix-turn-helix domain-containing protein [Pseudomonas]KAA6170419.1 winged helix-turn-helix domain-containing protein [Pseudomonas veronii]KAA6175535.1 winged helix-turn-helix domain-containing protein [Pseudomonas veronii]KAA8562102.1 hypothetical protein FX985_02168 [Pseudomonas extremaustralis]